MPTTLGVPNISENQLVQTDIKGPEGRKTPNLDIFMSTENGTSDPVIHLKVRMGSQIQRLSLKYDEFKR